MTEPEALPDGDIIPFDTGITLIDADPVVLARRLGDDTWETRAEFFNNVIIESISNTVKISEFLKPDRDDIGAPMLSVALCGIHERVAETLALWGAEAPPDIHAACIYALSMSLEHRRKANAFFKERGGDNYALIQEAWPGLAQFNLISITARPGLSELWRRHQEGCDCHCEEGGAS